MGVDVTIDGVPNLNITAYSVSEDSTPLDPSDTSGGVGQFTVTIDQDVDGTGSYDNFGARRLRGKTIVLSDGSQGTTTGAVGAITGTDGSLTLTVNSRLAQLAVDRTAQPFVGRLDDAFAYYLGLVGITSNFEVNSAIAATSVTLPGWSGNAWDYMKMIAISVGAEITLVSNNIILRPLRGRNAENYRDASATWAIDDSQLAQAIEIYYYENTYSASRLSFPSGGWNQNVPVIVVNAGETITATYDLDASLSSVVQPTCVAFVDQYEEGSSVYAVSGSDGLPITPAQWAAQGGSLSVKINDDTRSLTVTVTGPSQTNLSPYRIAMASGTNNYYSSLRIMGTGVFTKKQLLTLSTGVDTSVISTKVGVTVDNPFISSIDDAYRLGLWALKRYGAPRHTITVKTSGVNRIGDTGADTYPTITDFNNIYAGKTITDFNADWAGKTIADFNAYMESVAASSFANQAFGNVGGARVRVADAMYRIRSATIGPDSISYVAEEDTTADDFNSIWSGATIADFNAQWAGFTFADFAVAPLRRD